MINTKHYRYPLLTPSQASLFGCALTMLEQTEAPAIFQREGFKTLGAAAYIDPWPEYRAKAKLANHYISLYFKGLLSIVQGAVCETYEFPTDRVGYLSDLALPGFHIFDATSNGRMASRHVDEPFERIHWPYAVQAAASFTLPIRLPECGGGLRFWHEDGSSELATYAIGELYIHSGREEHQIENMGDMDDWERRVTLQGHVVVLDDDSVIFYF